MTKQELNEKLIDLYGLKHLFQTFAGFDENRNILYGYMQIIDDSARMFDLMIEHDIFLDFFWDNINEVKPKYYTARQKGVFRSVDMIFLKDHETPQAAARYAIAMALVKLAESKS